jgi:hypothetical protein
MIWPFGSSLQNGIEEAIESAEARLQQPENCDAEPCHDRALSDDGHIQGHNRRRRMTRHTIDYIRQRNTRQQKRPAERDDHQTNPGQFSELQSSRVSPG